MHALHAQLVDRPVELIQRRVSAKRQDARQPGEARGMIAHRPGAGVVPSLDAVERRAFEVAAQHRDIDTRLVHEPQMLVHVGTRIALRVSKPAVRSPCPLDGVADALAGDPEVMFEIDDHAKLHSVPVPGKSSNLREYA